MSELEKQVLEAIKKIRDPTSGAPLILTEATVEVKEIQEGVILITFIPSNPHSQRALTTAEAVKTIAQKQTGVKKVIIECKNHILADIINHRLNIT